MVVPAALCHLTSRIHDSDDGDNALTISNKPASSEHSPLPEPCVHLDLPNGSRSLSPADGPPASAPVPPSASPPASLCAPAVVVAGS